MSHFLHDCRSESCIIYAPKHDFRDCRWLQNVLIWELGQNWIIVPLLDWTGTWDTLQATPTRKWHTCCTISWQNSAALNFGQLTFSWHYFWPTLDFGRLNFWPLALGQLFFWPARLLADTTFGRLLTLADSTFGHWLLANYSFGRHYFWPTLAFGWLYFWPTLLLADPTSGRLLTMADSTFGWLTFGHRLLANYSFGPLDFWLTQLLADSRLWPTWLLAYSRLLADSSFGPLYFWLTRLLADSIFNQLDFWSSWLLAIDFRPTLLLADWKS